MPSAYIIAHVRVTNPEQYEEYRQLSSHALHSHEAEICVRGGASETLEGDWAPERMVVLKFPSMEAARAFNTSTEYGQARAARQGAAIMQMILVEGAD
jgi:uncharacterized protein (DUF1330 family)